MNGPSDTSPAEPEVNKVTEAISSEVGRKTKTLSQDVILQFFAVIRVVRFHSVENDAARGAMDRLIHTLDLLFELQYDVTILYYSRDLYVNDDRIKASKSNYEFFDKFGTFLEQRAVGSIAFRKRPTRETLGTLVTILNEVSIGLEDRPWDQVQERLAAAELTDIQLTGYAGNTLDDLPVIDKRTFTKQAYFRAISVAQKLFEQARDRKPLALKDGKRVVQNFVNLLTDPDSTNSDLLLLLTGVKNWRGYLFNHAVNTCVLSLGLGETLGLERNALRELGMAALLADIGNAVLPTEMLNTAGSLDEDQLRIMRSHPFAGVPLIAGYQQLDRGVVKAVMGCLTHHRRYDGGGYPNLPFQPGGLNRHIIAICDRYDALTTPRAHRRRPLSPPQALDELKSQAGTALHPLIVRAFVDWAGAVPSGTVVILNSGEIGLVVSPRSRARGTSVARIRVLDTGSGSLRGGSEIEVGDSTTRQVSRIVSLADLELAHRATAALVA